MFLLHRQVFGELLRVFGMVVSGLTLMLVFVGVVGEAAKHGLGPNQIVDILPYIIPSLLPFTIPATLLLTVCVVYGRMASDNEITATKAAGINIFTLLWPSFFLGAALSLGTLILTDQFIPWARLNIERIVTFAMEDIFLEQLSTKNQASSPDQGISITVLRIDGKRLVSPTFRYTPPNGGKTMTIQAAEATLKFDIPNRQVVLELFHGNIETPGETTVWVQHTTRSFPLSMHDELEHPRNIPIQQLRHELDELSERMAWMQEKQMITTAIALSEGHFNRLNVHEARNTVLDLEYARDRYSKLNTEIHSRIAMACSCFFFVTFGSPFAILQGRKQFLTNFLFCFLPILMFYYPVVLLSMNLAKSGLVDPSWGMWVANGVLGIISALVLRKVLQH